jgi:hypothetical protein|tara:strand:- start:6368 stop:6667 length:300 start_codon:yes stop_codon:yes gene_type:complete
MAQPVSKPIEITKERIKEVKFSEKDILSSKEQRLQRRIDLKKAATLGAQSKTNIKIYFVDVEGVRHRVVATVWAATESNVSFKGEVMVPIKSIYQVGFF